MVFVVQIKHPCKIGLVGLGGSMIAVAGNFSTFSHNVRM